MIAGTETIAVIIKLRLKEDVPWNTLGKNKSVKKTEMTVIVTN